MSATGERMILRERGGALRPRLSQVLGIDLRALALFRIALGGIVLVDLALRARDLRAHYTDEGVLPRADLIGLYHDRFADAAHWWSLHMASGTLWFESLLFMLAAGAAVLLTIGYRTRLAHFAVWALTLSLHVRNPFVLNAGDILLETLLFWSFFLPMGAVASVDAALRPAAAVLPKRVLSPGSAAILLQVCFVYWFTAALKTDPVWRPEYSAVYYALALDYFVRAPGLLLRRLPWLMELLARATLALEWLGPVAALSPVATTPLRLLAVLCFWCFHIGLFATMELGLFPWIAVIAWTLFLPSAVFDAASRRLRPVGEVDLAERAIVVDPSAPRMRAIRLLRGVLGLSAMPLRRAEGERLVRLRKSKRWFLVEGGGEDRTGAAALEELLEASPWGSRILGVARRLRGERRVGRGLRSLGRAGVRWAERLPLRRPGRTKILPGGRTGQGLALLLLVYIALWNVRELPGWHDRALPYRWNGVARATGLDQLWNMFAPAPHTEDGWFVMEGTLRDGETVNLWMPGEPLPWSKPSSVADQYVSQRWTKMLRTLWLGERKDLRGPFVQWLARRWNEEQAAGNPRRRVREAELYYQLEPTPPPGHPEPEPETILLWTWRWE